MSIQELMVKEPAHRGAEEKADSSRSVASLYSLLRLRPAGESRYRWVGRVLEVGPKHLRFELFNAAPPIEPGQRVEARCMLPSQEHVLFHATGHIAGEAEAAEQIGFGEGMVLWLESFPSDIDRFRLIQFLRPELFESEQQAA